MFYKMEIIAIIYYNIVIAILSEKMYNGIVFLIGGEVKALQEKNQKRNIILTVIVLLFIAAVSCVLIVISLNMQNNSKPQPKVYTADEVTAGVINKMNYQNLTQISAENIPKYYDIPNDMIYDSSMYISGRSDIGTEIACFKFRDEDDRDAIEKNIYEYTSSKINSYKEINESAVRSETSVIYPYVFVVISSDTGSAVTAFENIVK